MYSFPSTSQMRAPFARSTKNGSPPTLRNARTGEFTPPGIIFCAAAKSSDEREFTSKLEAGAGIEPANRGFADLGLTTWLPRRKRRGKYRTLRCCVNAAMLV